LPVDIIAAFLGINAMIGEAALISPIIIVRIGGRLGDQIVSPLYSKLSTTITRAGLSRSKKISG
jgi:hypothetical protein